MQTLLNTQWLFTASFCPSLDSSDTFFRESQDLVAYIDKHTGKWIPHRRDEIPDDKSVGQPAIILLTETLILLGSTKARKYHAIESCLGEDVNSFTSEDWSDIAISQIVPRLNGLDDDQIIGLVHEFEFESSVDWESGIDEGGHFIGGCSTYVELKN